MLDPKAPAKIELKMRKATRLWVDLLNADGENVSRCQLRVFDASDRDVGIRFWDDAPDDHVEGTLAGVLLPGKYRIVGSHESGVSTTTLRNWFHGATRRPQFCTVNAVARALGKELRLMDRKTAAQLRVIRRGRG